jgi:F-type H+-transporting ATPase subunit delta
MPVIIISYRRADSAAIAGRIYDRLVSQYGQNSVFMDIDSIPIGVDFREHISETLRGSDLLLAIIGHRWVGGGRGHTRISDETDPVRVELEVAFRNGVPIVPVLVDQAKMPKSTELPETLKSLRFLNAADVSSGRDFHGQIDRLLRAIDGVLARRQAPTAVADLVQDKLETSGEQESAGPVPAPTSAEDAALGSATQIEPTFEPPRTSGDGAPPTVAKLSNMVGGAPIVSGMAGRYATALFELALEQKALDAVRADLERFDALLADSDDLRRLVRSPVFTSEEQARAIAAVLDKVGMTGTAANFIRLVARNRRLFAIRQMIRAFRHLVARHRGEVTVDVTVAEQLSEAHLGALKDALRSVTGGKDIELDVKVEPAIIGGLVVKLGSRMVDSSLRTKLNAIKFAMKEAR